MDVKHENPHDMVQSILKNALGECSGIFDIIFLRLLNGITLLKDYILFKILSTIYILKKSFLLIQKYYFSIKRN